MKFVGKVDEVTVEGTRQNGEQHVHDGEDGCKPKKFHILNFDEFNYE